MRKYDFISALAQETAKEVVKNRDEWMKYLTTAARLYKYPFREQLLIYAQRPDATACASIELWNERMHCWVNKGAKGIALLDEDDAHGKRLKYVFDVSDVHAARRIGRYPELWELHEEHKEDVIKRLEQTYGASETLTSYQYVLHKNPQMAQEYKELLEKKKKMKKRSSERLEINKRLNRIRENLLEQEKAIIHSAVFIATTVSKATVDKALYMQRFDVVIFDEASMAYVPQIVFSAGLAKSFFICMGDFCQLPAIVQCKEEQRLAGDIFEYTGITSAVENDQCHGWLVMLDTQYRMHPDIADFVSKYMYGDRLKTYEKIIESRNEIASCKPCPDSAMALIDLSGMYSVCTRTKDGSRVNILSALLSLRMAEKSLTQFEVGIITPYSAQSRLILSMVRDIQEYDNRWKKVACATVHQFQGSEKPVIIYDAVDCYRMPYPGTLLTSLHNDNANRLFNVAFTRAKGKFILIANKEYLKIKHISKKLIFTKAIEKLSREKHVIEGGAVLDEFMPSNNEQPIVYVEDRETSWQIYIEDLQLARNSIYIDIPDVIDENDEAIKELSHVLLKKKEQGVDVRIRLSEDIDLPNELIKYRKNYEYVTNPITIIDKKIIWFGQPLYAADFISEGDIMDTEYFPCVRFVGKYTARSIQAFLEI